MKLANLSNKPTVKFLDLINTRARKNYTKILSRLRLRLVTITRNEGDLFFDHINSKSHLFIIIKLRFQFPHPKSLTAKTETQKIITNNIRTH